MAFSLRLDDKTEAAIRRLARETGRSRSAVVRDAMSQYIGMVREVEFARTQPSLTATPPWYDDALQTLADLARVRLERRVFDEQRRLLAQELRTTNQRVNLFERVKIPGCRDAIRRIRIVLGDVQTLDVARSKIAKAKTLERETAS